MGSRMRMDMAVGAKVVGSRAELMMLIGFETCAMARAQLRQCDADLTLQIGFCWIDRRRTTAEDTVGRKCIDSLTNDVSVDRVPHRRIRANFNHALTIQIGFHVRQTFRAEGFFHGSMATVESDVKVRRMVRLQRQGQKLGGQEPQVLGHRKLLALLMEMINVGRTVTAKDESKGFILDHLKAFDGRTGVIGKDHWCGVVEQRTDEEFVRT